MCLCSYYPALQVRQFSSTHDLPLSKYHDFMEWIEITPGVQWVLNHDGNVRQVYRFEPYLGQAGGTYYRVTGPDYEFTDHPTRDEAIAAAEASL